MKKTRERDPRMPTLVQPVNSDNENSRLVAVTLHTKHGRELRVLDLPRRSTLPRVIVWEWRTFLQELSSDTSKRYFECDSHYVMG